MLFYANRIDKDGNQLLTSYANEKSADKYGGAGAQRTNGILRASFTDGKLSVNETNKGPIVRSLLKNHGQAVSMASGNFVMWAKQNGEWSETTYRFDSYGAANTLMKAMINIYEALMIIDDNDSPAAQKATPALDMNDV